MTSTSADASSRARQVRVSAEEAGQRIDNFLARHLKGVPKSHIYRVLRRGEVRVNSGRVQASRKLNAGDIVRIPPVRTGPSVAKPAGTAAGQRLESAILLETDRYLVLNKPAGLAVHGGSGLSHGVIEAMRAARSEAPYLELAHRLDRDTSGCLVLAKRRSFLRHFQQQLRDGQVSKHYLALLAGQWQGGHQSVNVPLRKHQPQGGERVVRVDRDGKEALSEFRTLVILPGATLVDVELHTGRTHQIRVHAAHLGHPLAGDEKYGERAANRSFRELGLRRMFLHAGLLEFTDPASADRVTVSAPLDDELRAVLDRLESA